MTRALKPFFPFFGANVVVVAEIPGFYYDEGKNRYFPVKGPIPGCKSIRKPSSASTPKPSQDASATARADVKPSGLPQFMRPFVPSAFLSAPYLQTEGIHAALCQRQLYFNACAGEGVGRKYFAFEDWQETEMCFRDWNPNRPGYPTSGSRKELQSLTADVNHVFYVIMIASRSWNFQVWRYEESASIAEGALEIIPVNTITPEGETPIRVMLAGSIHGLLR